jgi:Fe-S-cluster containining protein
MSLLVVVKATLAEVDSFMRFTMTGLAFMIFLVVLSACGLFWRGIWWFAPFLAFSVAWFAVRCFLFWSDRCRIADNHRELCKSFNEMLVAWRLEHEGKEPPNSQSMHLNLAAMTDSLRRVLFIAPSTPPDLTRK